jgi:hypothetical protein
MRTLTAGLDQCPEFLALINEAGEAAKRITRKGFKDSDWVADHYDQDGNKPFDRADACAAASDSLIQIRNSLHKFTSLLQRLGRRHGGWERQFQMDCDIFFAQFRALYGDN